MTVLISTPDRLWTVVTEFGERARAHPDKVERAIRGFLETEVARHGAAKDGVADALDNLAESEAQAMASSELPDEKREELRRRFAQRRTDLAMQAGAIYRERLDASQPVTAPLGEKIAYLTRVHELVVAKYHDGDRRESRRPLAPALDGLLEVRWTLLVLPEDLERMRVDLEEKGSCRAAEYLAAIEAELPLAGEVTGQPIEAR